MKPLLYRLISLCLMASPASALECAPRDRAVMMLDETFGEKPIIVGAVTGEMSMMLEMFANPITGSWTLLITGANGIACMLESGTRLLAVAPGVPT